MHSDTCSSGSHLAKDPVSDGTCKQADSLISVCVLALSQRLKLARRGELDGCHDTSIIILIIIIKPSDLRSFLPKLKQRKSRIQRRSSS